MYIPLSASSSMISENMFYNLREIDTIQLSEPWWYSTFNDPITINDALYGAMGGAHIMVQDGIRVLAFNYRMMENLDLEKPYDMVREGKWTLDKFNEYLAAAGNLNGDASPAWNNNGKAVYGYSHNQTNLQNFFHGCGEFIVENKGGTLVYSNGSDHMYKVIDKLSEIFTTADCKTYSGMPGDDMDIEGGGYLYVFKTGRALFGQAEVCKFQGFRDLPFDFGVVPFPKYDESQENYSANSYPSAPAAFIPVTSQDPKHAGLILDAMAYEGERTVLPIFRELSVEQKGLRNDDSIEMLEIISDNLIPLYSIIYNIGTDFLDSISNEVWDKKGAAASIVAKNEDKIKKQIDKVLTAWAGE
ncbi:MAG: hypothetical protein MJ175_06950 [Clostridia bacterium]|nr:hypothetical protein [Clostridia bacterium]